MKWEKFYLLWPRRVGGRWRWLSHVERCRQCGGCAFYGDCWWEYRTC
jgi:hypothetical protein